MSACFDRCLPAGGGREIEHARLCPGSVFGEMSMLDKAPVCATVVADGVVDVIRVEIVELERVLNEDDGLGKRYYHSLAQMLVKRLRATNRNVQFVAN